MVSRRTSPAQEGRPPAEPPAYAAPADEIIRWNEELMTTRELMDFLSLSRTKIWELVHHEGLPAFKIGGDYRYRRSEVLRWLERFRVRPESQHPDE